MNRHLSKAIKWTEKNTGTDVLYLLTNGSWILLGQIIVGISAFFVTWIFANNLPKELFGQYRFILSVIPILAVFTLPALGTAIIRSIARGHLFNYRDILLTKLRWGMISLVLSLSLSAYYFLNQNVDLSLVFLMIGFILPFHNLFIIYNDYYQGVKNFRKSSTYRFVTQIFVSLALVTSAFISQNVLLLVSIYLLIPILFQAFFFNQVKNASSSSQKTGDEAMIPYGKKLSFIGAFGVVLVNLDKFLVWHFFGSELLAVYVIALSIPVELARLFDFIPQIALPKFSKDKWTLERKNYLLTKMLKFGVFLLIVSGIYVIISSYLFEVIFPKYPEALDLTKMASILIVTTPLSALLLKVFVSLKKERILLWVTILSILFQVFFFMILRDSIGISASVMAFFLKDVLIIIFLLFFLKKIFIKKVNSL